MKMTGTEKSPRIWLTTSRPELPSASRTSGEDKPRPFAPGGFVGFAMRARYANGAVSELRHQDLQAERYERLVFDDQDIGANLVRDLPARGIDQGGRLCDRTLQCIGHLGCREPFDRAKKKSDARPQAYSFETATGAKFIAGKSCLVDMTIDRHRVPNLQEKTIKRRSGAISAAGQPGTDNRWESASAN